MTKREKDERWWDEGKERNMGYLLKVIHEKILRTLLDVLG